MQVLVIGGTGFIGSHVTRQLAALRHRVTIVSRRGLAPADAEGVHAIAADRQSLEDAADTLRALRPDVVVDIVLSSGAQAEALVRTFRGATGRIVAVSSIDVYRACGVLHGLEPGPLEPVPLTEESPLRTRLQTYPPETLKKLRAVFGWLDDLYDKIPVERAVLSAGEDLPATVLRLPMVYGPGDPLHRLHPIIKRIEDGRRVISLSTSMAEWRAPRGYVENVAGAIVLAATSEHAAGRVYNVAEIDALSEGEWTRAVADAAEWDGEVAAIPDDLVPPHLKPPGNAAQHWTTDSSRIRRELGYREPIPRAEAIRRTIAWERQHPPAQFDPAAFDYPAEDAALGTEPGGPS
jgi:nucleoside-diphosphate-sugar epimerase